MKLTNFNLKNFSYFFYNFLTLFFTLTRHLRDQPTGNVSERTCPICKKVLKSKERITSHIRGTHGNKKEMCPTCGKSYKYLATHIKAYHASEPNKACTWEGCDKVFRFDEGLRDHIDKFHKCIRTQCDLCGEWIKTMYDHMKRKHKKGKPEECEQCDKVYHSKSDLRSHVIKAHEARRYVCPDCGKSFAKIKDHMKAVHGVTDVDMSSIHVYSTKL